MNHPPAGQPAVTVFTKTHCVRWTVIVSVQVIWIEGYAGNPKFSNQSHPAQPEDGYYKAVIRVEHDVSSGSELFMDYGEMTARLMGIQLY
jgi:hypothetical protein